MKLWNLEYPAKLSYDRIDDFDTYINGLESPTHILVRLNNEIVGGQQNLFAIRKNGLQ
ncbi:hypothetical protein [Albibacterium indicum]|uniref:hypothetical protein n=1 Tax=Albibacterium indicum TaxID=2292082 RepID=UPI0013004C6C|nr:hypothetical protein [Pedobacter indicus]